MKKIFLLGMASLLFTGFSSAQTRKDGKGKARDSVKTSTVKPCPGKTCGKKKH
ncbi:MAG TPA: hypothetical protein VG605_08530 [Puia sp.]|jgi:hypothetical protein|nr:hypothetical protein [Puia sp.]